MKWLGFVLVVFLTLPAYAQKVEFTLDDLKNMSDSERKVILDAVEKKKPDMVMSADQMREYADIAKVLGASIKEVCVELNVGVNEFIKTPAGMITVVYLGWQIGLGEELWSTFIRFCIFMPLLYTVCGYLLWRFIGSRKIVNEDSEGNKTISYEPRYHWEDTDNKGGFGAVLAIVFFVGNIFIFA